MESIASKGLRDLVKIFQPLDQELQEIHRKKPFELKDNLWYSGGRLVIPKPLATPDRPWGSISLDFIEGLPPSKKYDSKTYDSILVIVDRLTKFAILAPTHKTVTAKQTAPTIPSLPDEDLDFEVEALIDKRSHNGTTEYKVLWRGYSEEAASWEPVENLNCPDLIQEYEVSEGGQCHGPGCSRSRRVMGSYRRSTGIEDLVDTSREHGRSAVSMETMDSYRLTCKGGPSTAMRRTKLKEQAQPRGGPSSRSRHSHEEDQAQGACRWLPLRGSRDKSQRNFDTRS
ncbi:hypothetical protein NDA15_003035 [Ustilago hordei]|nr:hypothetical protein NDA15_003035 [Ustilago hordei]